MTARAAILARIRANRPAGTHKLPDPPVFLSDDGADLVATFRKNLEAMGGRPHSGPVAATLAEFYPDANLIVSTVPEHGGTRALCPDAAPASLADVDVAIVRAACGVAETGSVLLIDEALRVNALAYLAQHLVVLLRPDAILPTLHEAYRRSEFHNRPYACLHSGPSATADIEGVLIRGAQGVRSLTVMLG